MKPLDEIPGLVLLAAGQYRYTEPESGEEMFGGFAEEPGFVEFVFHPTDGTVEVSTAGAPMVPAEILIFIGLRAGKRDRP